MAYKTNNGFIILVPSFNLNSTSIKNIQKINVNVNV